MACILDSRPVKLQVVASASLLMVHSVLLRYDYGATCITPSRKLVFLYLKLLPLSLHLFGYLKGALHNDTLMTLHRARRRVNTHATCS